jgi:hypothetical protein
MMMTNMSGWCAAPAPAKAEPSSGSVPNRWKHQFDAGIGGDLLQSAAVGSLDHLMASRRRMMSSIPRKAGCFIINDKDADPLARPMRGIGYRWLRADSWGSG